MSIGKQLKRQRQAKGLTQEQLAAMAGISQSSVSEIENDQRIVAADVLERLSATLGTTPNSLRDAAFIDGQSVLGVWRTPYRMRPSEISFEVRLNQGRQTLGPVVEQLYKDFKGRQESEWWLSALRRWPFESGLEAVLAVRLLLEGALLTKVRLTSIGFPLPIVDPQSRVCTGTMPRWSLAILKPDVRLVLTPCVTVQVPPRTSATGRRRLDLAVVARIGKMRYCGVVEVDGRQHLTQPGQSEDRARDEELDLPILRITEDALKTHGLLARIVQFARSLPHDKRSRAGVPGRWR